MFAYSLIKLSFFIIHFYLFLSHFSFLSSLMYPYVYLSGEPDPPSGLSIAEPASSDSVNITWSAYTSSERRLADNFVVELSDDEGSTYNEVRVQLPNETFCDTFGHAL